MKKLTRVEKRIKSHLEDVMLSNGKPISDVISRTDLVYMYRDIMLDTELDMYKKRTYEAESMIILSCVLDEELDIIYKGLKYCSEHDSDYKSLKLIARYMVIENLNEFIEDKDWRNLYYGTV